jgi:hypothetical protein
MRWSIHVAGLCFLFGVLIASPAQAQLLKAGNAQIQNQSFVLKSTKPASQGGWLVERKFQFILVKSVKVPSDGWLAAHNNQGGQPNKIIGFTLVNSGTHSIARIPILTGTVEPGASIILMLHEDNGTKGMFDTREDKPVVKGGKPMMVVVKIQKPSKISK